MQRSGTVRNEKLSKTAAYKFSMQDTCGKAEKQPDTSADCWSNRAENIFWIDCRPERYNHAHHCQIHCIVMSITMLLSLAARTFGRRYHARTVSHIFKLHAKISKCQKQPMNDMWICIRCIFFYQWYIFNALQIECWLIPFCPRLFKFMMFDLLLKLECNSINVLSDRTSYFYTMLTLASITQALWRHNRYDHFSWAKFVMKK